MQLVEDEEEEEDVHEEGSEEEHEEPSGEEIVEEESWVDWIRRATRNAEGHLRRLKIEDWVTKSRRMKWSWAGHVARRNDGRWSTAILNWKPVGGKRKVGHPTARWRDDLASFCKTYIMDLDEDEWVLLTQDREGWATHEAEYAEALQRGQLREPAGD